MLNVHSSLCTGAERVLSPAAPRARPPASSAGLPEQPPPLQTQAHDRSGLQDGASLSSPTSNAHSPG